MSLFGRLGRQLRHSSLRRPYSTTSSFTGAPPLPSLARKVARRTAYTAAGLGTAYLADRELNASAIARNVRTLYTCFAIILDYKLSFTPENSQYIPELHERVANRLYDLIISNGGLYIKLGQAIGHNVAILPPALQAQYARLFDDAPQVPYETVKAVFVNEFGAQPDGPDGIFAEFETQAVASASVAQVHRARIKNADGTPGPWVAVKIQKPDVAKQVEWDLAAYKTVMAMYSYWFQLPVTFISDFMADHLRRELDFVQEAKNAMETRELIAKEPRLADRVYVPKVYPEYSTAKVMTAEWIDGVRLTDRAGVRALMDESPSNNLPIPMIAPGEEPSLPAYLSGPLRGGTTAVAQALVDLFSAQIFDWGWVHCDPHPGNVLIRAHPDHPELPQLVLLDHGLYVRLNSTLRIQYATLWKGLLTLDYGVITSITRQWGFGAPDMFASATLMKPVSFPKEGGGEQKPLSEYELGVQMKKQIRSFLADTDAMPKELVFIGRNMRIVQGNNQALGSPVNRVKTMGVWAGRALADAPGQSFTEHVGAWVTYTRFRTALLALDAAFWFSQTRYRIRGWFGLPREGFEDELEKTMLGIVKSSFGVEVGPEVFQG